MMMIEGIYDCQPYRFLLDSTFLSPSPFLYSFSFFMFITRLIIAEGNAITARLILIIVNIIIITIVLIITVKKRVKVRVKVSVKE
jgi:hypothetical protein